MGYEEELRGLIGFRMDEWVSSFHKGFSVEFKLKLKNSILALNEKYSKCHPFTDFPPKSLTWTREKPTKDGWYWYKEYGNKASLWNLDTSREYGLWLKWYYGGTVRDTEAMNGTWSGPIPEPEEKITITNEELKALMVNPRNLPLELKQMALDAAVKLALSGYPLEVGGKKQDKRLDIGAVYRTVLNVLVES